MTTQLNKAAPGRSPWADPGVWVIFLVALALRLAYLTDLRHTPFFSEPQMDAAFHHQWAQTLAAGQWRGTEVFFRAPLYPYFLGVLYAVTQIDLTAVRVVQFVIGAFTAALTVVLGRPRFGRMGATLAGLLVACSGPLIYFEGELLLVVLEAPLFLLSAWAFDRAMMTFTGRRWFAAGALMGLAALVRPIMLAVVPVAAVAAWRRGARPGIRATTSLLAGTLALVSPALIHNYAVGRDIVPVASQGGLNYYLGNNPSADGRAAVAPEFRRTWHEGIGDARRFAEQSTGRSLRPSEVSSFWYRRAWEWAAREPGAFLKLQARKLAYFWDSYEIPNNQDYYYFSRLTRVFRANLLPGWGVLGPLALAGLVLGFAGRRVAFAWVAVPTVLMLVIVAFFVCGRFRAPLIPLFALWAGWGFASALHDIRYGDRGRFLGYSAILLLSAWMINADLTGVRENHTIAESHMRLGVFYAAKNEDADALAHYKSAVRVKPDFADGWNNLGAFAASRGRLDEAGDAFATALLIEPRHPKALGNRAALAWQRGEVAAADSLARATLAVAGREPAALYNAAVVLGNLGDISTAREAFAALVRLEPGNAAARLGLAKATAALGDTARARRELLEFPPSARTPEMERWLDRWRQP